MSDCIICDNPNPANSVEHIVSESFGNKRYVLDKGIVCDECNNRLSKSENKALTNSIFMMERARSGHSTKKGKSPKGKVKEIEVTGDPNFRKNVVQINGLNKDNVENFDPSTGIFEVKISSFDKSEVAVSKMLLKTGYEALYKSRKKEVIKRYNFSELKEYLSAKSNLDWGFIATNKELGKYISIPKFMDKLLLRKIDCELKFQIVNDKTILFRFRYMGISMIINLLSRDLDWVNDYRKEDDNVSIHPKHLEKKRTNLKS